MQALILCAGKGTRLRPLTLQKPKPMLPVAGKPLLEYTINWLKSYGITEIAINLHYKPQAIVDYFGDGSRFGVKITYSYEKTILGTAGAIRKLKPFFQDTFIVMYGDLLTDMNLTRLVRFHRQMKSRHPDKPCLTLSLYRVSNPWECGIVELDASGRVVRFVEKPSPEEAFSDLSSAGVMVMEPGIIDYIPSSTFYDIGYHLIPKLLEEGVPIYGLPLTEREYLIDIGTPGKYRQANLDWAKRGGSKCSSPELPFV